MNLVHFLRTIKLLKEVSLISYSSPVAFFAFLIMLGMFVTCVQGECIETSGNEWISNDATDKCNAGEWDNPDWEPKKKENRMLEISQDQAITMIQNTNGRFFGVDFQKKNSDEVRVMNARTGVSRYVTGGGLKFDATQKGLIPVYDIINKGYRMININGLMKLRTNGETYIIV